MGSAPFEGVESDVHPREVDVARRGRSPPRDGVVEGRLGTRRSHEGRAREGVMMMLRRRRDVVVVVVVVPGV
jgi:hypothetical protein